MKKLIYSLITLIMGLVCCVSCDDSITAGSQLLDKSEYIIVGCDTFLTSSALTQAHDIYTTPDSFLLGECDSRFGTIHADILAQFTCPQGFQYPSNAEVDSVCLFFYYDSWFGSGNTPMSLSVYEMDKQTFSYATPYSHNIEVDDYVTVSPDNNILARQRFLVASHPTDSIYNNSTGAYDPYVRMRLNDTFSQKLFGIKDFSSQEAFNQQFKGLYIASDFGSATLLHVSDINLAVYYHFSYNKAGRDTTVYDVKGFYANSEVRQINRYVYINEDLASLNTDPAINYVVSPAGLYTRVSLPMREIATTILDSMRYTNGQGDTLYRRPYINKADLTFQVLNAATVSNPTRDDWARPAANMLLIKESAVDRFFTKNELPSDTCAILASLVTYVDDDKQTQGYYQYSLNDLLAEAVRNLEKEITTAKEQGTSLDVNTIPETLDMLLIPVSVGKSTSQSSSYYSYYYSGSSTAITSVKHEQVVTATVLRSAQDSSNPLSIEVVYSGF